MLGSVFTKTLRDARRSILFYSIGSIALGLYVTLFYPTIRDATGFTEFLSELPEVMQSIMGDVETFTTAEGFLNVEMFSFMAPMIIGIFAIMAGVGAIAGEEESHTLDQLMANPITRTSIVLHKAAALLVALLAISTAMFVGLFSGSVLADFELSLSGVAQVLVSQFALAAVLGFIALAVGASTGKKGLAAGAAAAVGVVGFLLDTFLSVVDVLDPARFISVFYYFNSNDVILNGINPVHFITLVAIAAIAVVVSIWRFEKRDLSN
jgi:ABC-2 type transport system permease protein